MRLRRLTFILLAFALLLLLAGGLALSLTATRLYSSPSAPRKDSRYAGFHAPSADLPPAPTNLAATLRVDEATNQVTITWPFSLDQTSDAHYRPVISLTAGADQQVRLSDTGLVKLAWILTGYTNPPPNFEWSIEIPPKFFDAQLKPAPLAENADSRTEYQQPLQFQGVFPTARFVFASSNLPSCKFLNFAVFDHRTHQSLTSGHSSSRQNDTVYFETPVQLWHQAPIDVVLKLAAGQTQTHKIDLFPGAELRFERGLVRVLGIYPHHFNSSSSHSDGRTNITVLRDASSRSAAEPQASVLLYVWPHGYELPADLEFFDENLKPIPSNGSASHGNVIRYSVAARPDQVKKLHLKYFAREYRITFTLPELPGLPDENRNVQNLFDVKIPYLRLQDENALERTLGSLLQMQVSNLGMTNPPAFFPSLRTNTTPRALLAEADSLITDRQRQIVVDAEKNIIEARPHPIKVLFSKLARKVGL